MGDCPTVCPSVCPSASRPSPSPRRKRLCLAWRREHIFFHGASFSGLGSPRMSPASGAHPCFQPVSSGLVAPSERGAVEREEGTLGIHPSERHEIRLSPGQETVNPEKGGFRASPGLFSRAGIEAHSRAKVLPGSRFAVLTAPGSSSNSIRWGDYALCGCRAGVGAE